MASRNFEFLKANWDDLACLGGLAEQYVFTDPPTAVSKLRIFAEQIVLFIYHKHGLPKASQNNLNDLMRNACFFQVVPRVVLNKLDTLRLQGNRGVHGEDVPSSAALWVMQEAFELGCWLSMSYGGRAKSDLPAYVPPTATEGTEAERKLKRERTAILARVAAQDAEMRRLLADLEVARASQVVAPATDEELESVQEQGRQVADTLDFDEAKTRTHLIDTLLVTAGWDVGHEGVNTEAVGQEYEVLHQPTPSGKGKADYVLWGTNGKPLAVVEGKKTAVDAEAGRTQAKCYADGLEAMTGQRPVIFYTNGHDIWIWDDARGEPPRNIHGFYSQDNLEYLHFRRVNHEPLTKTAPSPVIAGRMYQIEAIKRVVERFAARHRKALIVQATGTGKTRVAVSLAELLLRTKWAKRILFLCDRKELRKQASNAFKEYLPGEPRTIVSSATSRDREKRVYLSTYPAMMECFESFDVGFFDLVIADESHRSIYNRYADLFAYFDCLQVGLTATPVDFIARNTYKIFGCEDRDPTAYFSFEDAINHEPPYLVPFEVVTCTTPFLRKGIKYSEMSEEQRRQLDEDEATPTAVEYDKAEVDKAIFNRDTNRIILRNLMEHGIRDATGTRIGKSILFARSHEHAKLLREVFDELYPQFGGTFCQIIDSHDDRAEALIDDFKSNDGTKDLTVAISVDMLDTGIDVPEVVNLVFAKPVFSYVKFWQMIGRGTRLRENLFGSGLDKSHFLIFDHWGNFEFFDQRYKPVEPKVSKSLPQRLFEARIGLAEVALQQSDLAAFETAIGLISKDIADLPGDTISVKEKWKEIEAARNPELLHRFEPATKALLLNEIAPLMQWRNIGGSEEAHGFDLLVCRLQTEHLKGSSSFDDLKAEMVGGLDDLRVNLGQVKAVAPTIAQVRTSEFWKAADVAKLEEVRQQLRGVTKYRLTPTLPPMSAKIIDVKEDPTQVERARHVVKLEGLQLAAYRNRVENLLKALFETNETLQRIKRGQPVSEADLEVLSSLVLTQDPMLDLHDLLDYYPDCAGQLDRAIRSIIGLDAAAVGERFTTFVQQSPTLNSSQIRFLDLLQNHIAKHGAIEVARLYEPPFTTLHTDSIDGLFPDEEQAGRIVQIIKSFQTPNAGNAVA